MAELSPEFVTTANRMGVPLPPRHRPRFLSRWFRIDWTGALTAPARLDRQPAGPFVSQLNRDIADLARITATPPLYYKP